MIVVSDTSAIIALLQIQRAEMLTRLYSRIGVPPEVESELRRFHPAIPDFIPVVRFADRQRFLALCAEVDPGEAFER